MHRLTPSLAIFLLLFACRSTVKPSTSLSFQAPEAPAVKLMPLTLGDGYTCVLNRRGQAHCLGTMASSKKDESALWQTLRAAGSTPALRDLVSRSTVTCGIGVKPPSLENRILCWQPRTSRSPKNTDIDAMMLSAKMNGRLRSLALQKDKVCALLSDGQIGCGDLSGNSSALKISVLKGLRSIRSLRSGDGFSCGLRGDTGAIFCWGENSKGQLGLGSQLSEESEAVAIAGFYGFATAIDAGSHHACAINDSGEVFCWGDNSDQQLGVDNSEKQQSAAPQIVRGLPEKAEALALGEKHSCAQLVNGSVWCWGAADFLGMDTSGGLIPVKVQLPEESANIEAGLDRSCSQLTTGRFYCWASEPEAFLVPR